MRASAARIFLPDQGDKKQELRASWASQRISDERLD
jgi:hypothetical protein